MIYKLKIKIKTIKNMEKQKLSAEASLELISQMINQSKMNLNGKSFNSWIGWGVYTLLLGIAILAIVEFTGVQQWYWLWFLEFVYAIFDCKRNQRQEPKVKTHIDNAIVGIWSALGWLYILTPVAMTFSAIYLQHFWALNMIMPLVLIYTIVGVAFTGVILREKWITAIPVICSISPLYMFAVISSQQFAQWHMVLFMATFFVVMVVPGIILNYKCKRLNK